jgi:hypothetical protein
MPASSAARRHDLGGLAAQAAAAAACRGRWRSDALPDNPPDERGNSPILPWRNSDELAEQLRVLGMLQH